MKIDFQIWNGVMYVPIQHQWILDEITVTMSGVTVKIKPPEEKKEDKK